MGQPKYRSLRGMPDVLPETASAMRNFDDIARSVFRLYGFDEIRTPILEATEVFTTGVGESTDIVEKEMYSFTDRGGKSVSLRPEGTASIMRLFIEHGMGNTPDVFKVFYSGPMFRGERPQKGRLRQFHQIGAEIIGSKDPYSDAELIMSLEGILNRLGITGHTILLNSLGCPPDRERYSKALSEYLGSRFDGLCDDCKRRSQSNVLRVLDCKSATCREIAKGAPGINSFLCGECLGSYEKLKQVLKDEKVPVREKPDLVRGLDYYTGVIFEVSHPSLGSQDALAAGGRYDGLSSRMGGPDVGATGYALGVERLLLVVEKGVFRPGEAGVLVIPVDDGDKGEAFRIAERLRANGVLSGIDLTGRSMKAQMRKAGKENRDFVVFVSKAPENGSGISLKNMNTGQQTDDVDLEELIESLKSEEGRNRV